MNWKKLSNFGDAAQTDFLAIKIILSEMNIDWIVAIVSRQQYYLKANYICLTLIFQLVHFSVIVLLQKSFIVVHLV